MLRLYNAKGEYTGTLTRAINQHRHRTLADGDETLDFECPNGEDAGKIEVEGYVQTDKQEYVIKGVTKETSSTTTYVECALNIEALEGKAIPDGFETVGKMLSECMEVALSGTGWVCSVDPKITKRRTVRIEEDTNAWQIIKAAISAYTVEIRVETLEKCVYFVETRGEEKGCYFYEGLNLRSLGVQESSYGFYTRLIPIGKDGLHLSIDGKNYIENHQYSTKTITAVWRDERYTDTTSLYEDAVARLEEASRPVTAYSGDLIDLAKQSGKYEVLDYDLGDVIILASRTMNVWEKQRIVQIDEYDDWKKNTIELSSTIKTFAQIQKEGDELAKKEKISVTGRIFQEQIKETKEEVEESIREQSVSLSADIGDVQAGLYAIATADDIKGFKEGETTLFAQIQDENQQLWSGLDARVTSDEFGKYKEAVVSTYATIDDMTAGLDARVTSDEFGKYKEANTKVFAQIDDDLAGCVKEAYLELYAVSDGKGHSTTFADLVADTIALKGRVDLTGTLSVSNGIITSTGQIISQRNIRANTGLSSTKLELDTNDFKMAGHQYVPTEITSTTGAVMALGYT